MLNKNFCHLHVHNEYSLLDGLGTAKDYVDRAKEMGFEYLALTNHGNIDGLIKFQTECDKQGIKPVLGAELYVVKDVMVRDKDEKKKHIVLLVKNEEGWEKLCRLITLSNLEGFYKKPRIDYQMLMSMNLSGLVILTACVASIATIIEGREFIVEASKDTEFFMEIMSHPIEEQYNINEICLNMESQFGIPLVATNDCHYPRQEHSKVQEVLLAMQRKAKWSDKDRWRFDIDRLYLRGVDELAESFEEQGQLSRCQYVKAMRNTLRVAKLCSDFRIPKKEVKLPVISKKPDESLYRVCNDKLDSLLMNDGEKKAAVYRDRMKEELFLIRGKGFAQYFLIVKELIDWCKKEDIMIGEGRGSVGGSLVAYLLGITGLDPLHHNLIFSRFINSERIDLPDIDVDFEDTKRYMVRGHLEELYGKNNIAGVSTFLTMKGKAAIRDVARVFECDNKVTDEFAKAMDLPDDDGNFIEKYGEETPEGQTFKEMYPEVFRIAVTLEGQVKAVGQHAAALVISDEDLTTGTRGNLCRRGGEGFLVSNWDMKDSEHVGLLKLDVLGLNTLSVLHGVKNLINNEEACSGAHVDEFFKFDDILFDDKKTFGELVEGNTVGVFQLTKWVSTDLCKRVEVDSFSDIVAILALARPGALASGMTDMYIERKHGERWKRRHKIYERITKDTYGVPIYQEQIMQIIHEMAGLEYSDVDTIRRVIGKKRDKKEFAPYKKKFVRGCRRLKTFSKDEAEEFWEALLNWAGYGFVKAHAVGYAILAYRTAYLKFNYPVEFVCASLTYGSEGHKGKNKVEMVEEAKRLGLQIMPPKVGISDSKEWVIGEGHKLYVPFIEIKGVGEVLSEKCKALGIKSEKRVRTQGFFKVEGADNTKVSKSKIEKIMDSIQAYDKDSIPEGINDLFSFDIDDD